MLNMELQGGRKRGKSQRSFMDFYSIMWNKTCRGLVWKQMIATVDPMWKSLKGATTRRRILIYCVHISESQKRHLYYNKCELPVMETKTIWKPEKHKDMYLNDGCSHHNITHWFRESAFWCLSVSFLAATMLLLFYCFDYFFVSCFFFLA